MSRVILDNDLLSWEVYASGGKFGLPEQPKIVFHCLSDPLRRSRYLVYRDGDNADAEQAVHERSESELRDMLTRSRELD